MEPKTPLAFTRMRGASECVRGDIGRQQKRHVLYHLPGRFDLIVDCTVPARSLRIVRSGWHPSFCGSLILKLPFFCFGGSYALSTVDAQFAPYRLWMLPSQFACFILFIFLYSSHLRLTANFLVPLFAQQQILSSRARAIIVGARRARYFMRRYTPAFREAFSVMGPTAREPLEDREGSGSFPWRFASPHGLSLMICRTRPAAVSRNACMRCVCLFYGLFVLSRRCFRTYASRTLARPL